MLTWDSVGQLDLCANKYCFNYENDKPIKIAHVTPAQLSWWRVQDYNLISLVFLMWQEHGVLHHSNGKLIRV